MCGGGVVSSKIAATRQQQYGEQVGWGWRREEESVRQKRGGRRVLMCGGEVVGSETAATRRQQCGEQVGCQRTLPFLFSSKPHGVSPSPSPSQTDRTLTNCKFSFTSAFYILHQIAYLP